MSEYCKQADFRAAFRAERSAVASASRWLHDTCRDIGVPSDALDRLDICLNEVFANILSHGGAHVQSHPVELEIAFRDLSTGPTVDLTITDAGKAFDPTAASPRPHAVSLEDARPGGLGIIMLRDNADVLSYQHVDGLNRLTISVGWPVMHE